MKLIVGLGNPGPKYEGTRHNIGFDVIDGLARRYSIEMKTEKFHAWYGKGDIDEQAVVLLKPTTFMNRSGQAVAAAGRFFKLELADLLVISDDMALPLGRLRMRTAGSAGGHNGLQDVSDRIGSTDWCRLRIGIGEPVGVPSVYVLTRFAQEECQEVEIATERAVEAAVHWMRHGPDLTMTRYNGDPPGLKRTDDDE